LAVPAACFVQPFDLFFYASVTMLPFNTIFEAGCNSPSLYKYKRMELLRIQNSAELIYFAMKHGLVTV
jgi:hypothetical protein